MSLSISQKRKILIDLARRHQRAGSGNARAFLGQGTTRELWLDLTPILSPIHWAVVNDVATRLYMPERATLDLDVAIAFEDAEKVREKLERVGFIHQGELSIGGSAWTAPNGQNVDVIEGRESWWKDAIAEVQTNRNAQGLPILPLRYLVLMKFQSGRVQDIADVTRMLGQADKKSLDAVRAIQEIRAKRSG